MGRRTKLNPSSASHWKSRSAKGSLRPLNVLRRLNPRHGGSLAAEASGNTGASAPAVADTDTPKPAAAMVLRNSLLEVFMPLNFLVFASLRQIRRRGWRGGG